MSLDVTIPADKVVQIFVNLKIFQTDKVLKVKRVSGGSVGGANILAALTYR